MGISEERMKDTLFRELTVQELGQAVGGIGASMLMIGEDIDKEEEKRRMKEIIKKLHPHG